MKRRFQPAPAPAQQPDRGADGANVLPQYVDIGIGARALGISRRAFRMRLLRNAVPGVRRFGRDYVFDPEQFRSWLEASS